MILYDFVFFFFKHKTAYELRISDWSSDVCSSDLHLFDILDPAKPAAAFAHPLARAFERDPIAFGRQPDAQRPSALDGVSIDTDRKSTRLNSSHSCASRMPSSACKKKTY